MSSEDNKALVRRFYEEVVNQKNTAAIDEFFAPNIVDHTASPGTPGGIEGPKLHLDMYLTAFPGLHLTVEDMIAEGDKVVARVTARGTHLGELRSTPPTDKQMTVTAIDIYRIAGGKFVEYWGIGDDLGLLQQLGVIPATGQGTA